ncbi:3D (Asp-Asp-Asp) domain-containing protein [Bacillus horti]|uniref:3D (Asp-Asp-Asp) domain-containing protein n=1 Tax=Caldalkalibacillus horti TaxID=77523 RepID=A0ABT9VU33_9BACI|nr:3D (Asp-Asp-Asp) domain-containing protein [Bacillus horti]
MKQIKQISLILCFIVFCSLSVLSSVLWMTGFSKQVVLDAPFISQELETDEILEEELLMYKPLPLSIKEQQIIMSKNEFDSMIDSDHSKLVLQGFLEDDSSILNRKDQETEQNDHQETSESFAEEAEAPDIQTDEEESFEAELFDNHVQEEESSIDSLLDINYDLAAIEANLNLEQFEVINVLATGYTAGFESTGKYEDHPGYGITFSGVKVRRDLYSTIAADVTVFPLGTILYIPNYGYGVVADTGGAIKGNKIDLYFETVDDVYRFWGKKTLDVYVIQHGEGEMSESWLDELNDDATMNVYKVEQLIEQ